jgi:hypothetical protein
MKTAVRKALFSGVTIALLFASVATFAQGGGNGQGGSGGGNAHSAATAGMTHLGDPVSGPYAPHPMNMDTSMSKTAPDSTAMQQGDAQGAMKAAQ